MTVTKSGKPGQENHSLNHRLVQGYINSIRRLLLSAAVFLTAVTTLIVEVFIRN